MVFRTGHLIKKELRELNKVIYEWEDIEKRTHKSIEILKKIFSALEQGGEFEKAKKLREEISLLEREIYEDKKAERLAQIAKDRLPKILKGKL